MWLSLINGMKDQDGLVYEIHYYLSCVCRVKYDYYPEGD